MPRRYDAGFVREHLRLCFFLELRPACPEAWRELVQQLRDATSSRRKGRWVSQDLRYRNCPPRPTRISRETHVYVGHAVTAWARRWHLDVWWVEVLAANALEGWRETGDLTLVVPPATPLDRELTEGEWEQIEGCALGPPQKGESLRAFVARARAVHRRRGQYYRTQVGYVPAPKWAYSDRHDALMRAIIRIQAGRSRRSSERTDISRERFDRAIRDLCEFIGLALRKTPGRPVGVKERWPRHRIR